MQAIHSKVNVRKLVNDLADMYQDSTFDVALTEIVANALDAKATDIAVSWDKQRNVLAVADNGAGMTADAFAQYHDFATELKTRGDGIGFAGVGAKISFNMAKRVITQTRCGGVASASDWYWVDNRSLVWKYITPDKLSELGELYEDGTRVEIHFHQKQAPQGITSEYLIRVLKHHYLPLFVTEFMRSYAEINFYPVRLRFRVNGSPVPQTTLAEIAALKYHETFAPKVKAHPVGWGAIGISEHDNPLGEHSYGILLCTHGKVIKPELFGLSTGMLGAKLCGVVEMPGLIDYLTINKSDIKGGLGHNIKLNRMLGAVGEVMQTFLRKHGVSVATPHKNQLSAKLERELTKMMKRLPELQDFDGLLQKSRALRKNAEGDILSSPIQSHTEDSGAQAAITGGDNTNASEPAPASGGQSRQPDKAGDAQAKHRRSRKNHGPRVAFEDHSDRGETAWIQSDTIIINSGHAAYRNRITHDQARLTYCMFAIGVALDKAGLIRSSDVASYVDKFVTTWGES